MVLTGVGVEHEQFLKLAEEIFTPKKPIWTEDRIEIDSVKECDDSISQYTGGIVKVS